MEYHRHHVAYSAMCQPLLQGAVTVSLLVVLTTGGCSVPPAVGVDFSMAWAKKWQDTHYDEAVGSAYGYGIAVDDRGSLYISGATQEGSGTPYSGFITKFDSPFNEI